jgi:predicted Zn finger-like uncharacterized protein
MLFRCARCKTRYRVADHRVQGRRFRVTCKACGVVLIATAPTSNATPPPAHPPSPSQPVDAQEWYVAVKKKQRGPLSHAEVSGLVSDRSLSPRSYVWKPGMPEWVRLGNLDTFHDALVIQRAQMALSEPSYAVYMAKVRGEPGGEEAVDAPKYAAKKTPESTASEEEAPLPDTATQPPEPPDEISSPPEPKLEITDPRQMLNGDNAPVLGTTDAETTAVPQAEDESAPVADPGPAEPFDDTATIADEPLFTREALKRLDKKRGFQAMDTQISAPPDMGGEDVLHDQSPSTVDEMKGPANVLATTPDEPVEGYEGPAEPFPPFSTDASASESTAPDGHTSDLAMASTMADEAIPAVANQEDKGTDSVEPNDPPAPNESLTESDEPTTDEQAHRGWDGPSAESPPTEPDPTTPEEDDAPAPSDDVLNIDDLLEESVPEEKPPAPPGPAPPGPPPMKEDEVVEAAAVEDKMVHRHTDDEMLVLEGSFFGRAETHLQQEQALEQAVLDRMPHQESDEDHHEAATAPITDDEIDALVQSLGILVRREKQSRRMGLLFSLLVVAIVIGVGVAGASSQRGNKKGPKRHEPTRSAATQGPEEVPRGQPEPKTSDAPRASAQKTERITDLDWDDSMETQGSKRATTGTRTRRSNTRAVHSNPTPQRKKPAEAIDRAELKRMVDEDIGRKGLVIAIKTKTTAKKRRVNDEDINRLINTQMRHFKRCGRSNMPGMTLKLVFRINTQGSVDSIRTTPSTGPDRAVENCVRNKVKKWRFRPLNESQTFRRTLVF